MTTKRILVTRPDGGLSVFTPAPGGQRPGESEADWLARVAAKAVAAVGGASHRIVEAAALPAKRWRNAWQDTGAAVVVGLVRARLIRRRELLERREVVLRLVSEAIERRLDDGEPNGATLLLRAKRRRLREMDTTLDTDLAAITDLAVLDAFTPADLA